MIEKCAVVALSVSFLFVASFKHQPTSTSSMQPNTVKECSFQGETLKDGEINAGPGVKLGPGSAKNTVTLMRPNGNAIAITCFCVLEGGDCWAVSNPTRDGGVGVGCASQNCAGGEEPFCFMDIGDDFSRFNIRLAVAARR